MFQDIKIDIPTVTLVTSVIIDGQTAVASETLCIAKLLGACSTPNPLPGSDGPKQV